MPVQTLKRAGFGFILGMAVGNLIAALTGCPDIVSSKLLEWAGSLSTALIWQTLLSGVIGAAGFAGVTYYDIEHWSLLRAVTVHYVSYIVIFLPIAFFLGWVTQAAYMLLMSLIMAVVHLIIFFIMCAIYRAQVRELNQLNKLRKQQMQQHIGGAV